MRFDIFNWNEVKPNEENKAPQGRLRLMCSEISKIYVSSEGYEVLAAVGTTCDLQSAEPLTYRVEAPKGTRVFIEQLAGSHTKTTGEVFTNIDRLPMESGSMLEVKKAMRTFQLEQRALLQGMRSDAAALKAERAALKATAPEPVAEPEPEPEPEEQPEADPAEK